MKKWKAILFGTMLTLSLCTFTACGTEVNNADETQWMKKDTNENNAAEDETMEAKADNDGVKDNGEHTKIPARITMRCPMGILP